MTGIFEVYINGEHVKDVEMEEEIDSQFISHMLTELHGWMMKANQDDVFEFKLKVRCELPT